MEGKNVGDVTVNDGGGLYDNEGMCDLLIKDLNSLVKELANSQFLQFCIIVTGMTQKIMNLKQGIKADMDSMKEKVEDLKRINDSLFKQVTGLPVEKDGASHDD